MSNEIQFILYQLPDEEGKIQVIIKDDTIWATQKAMAQLFGVGVPAISKHLNHIFEEGELDKDVVISKMEITTPHGAIEGKTQKTKRLSILLTPSLPWVSVSRLPVLRSSANGLRKDCCRTSLFGKHQGY